MQYILILIGIWMIIAFIYSKVKNESFLKSIVLIPLILLKFIFERGGSGSSYSDIAREAKKQGRDDVLEKIDNAKQANAQAASYAQQAVDKIKNKDE